tara:strand:+ start:522 stop:2249 length:1728 start_codon:yes stop_codon:yes gene_type:complete
MTISIQELRKKFPDQSTLSDGQFTWDMWSKYYKDGANARPMGQFADEIGLNSEAFDQMVAAGESSGYRPSSSSSIENGQGNQVINRFSQNEQSFEDPNSDALTTMGAAANYAQGVTIGGSDELIGALTAVRETLGGSDLSFDELYNRAKDFEMARINDYREKSPGKAFAAEIGGAVTTGIATRGATLPMLTMKSPAFLQPLISGTRQFLTNNPAIRTALQASGWGGVYGFNTGEEGERIENAKTSAKWSAVFGFGFQKVAGPVSKKFQFYFNKASKSPTIENLQKAKNAAYKAVTDLGIKYDGLAVDKFRRLGMYGDETPRAAGQTKIIEGATDAAYNTNPNLYPYAKSAIELYDTTLQKMKASGGATVQQLDDLSKNMWRILKDSKYAEPRIYPLINSIDDLIASHADGSAAMLAAKEQNKIYSKSKMLDGLLDSAEVKANNTNNLSAKYRAVVATIINSKTYNRFLNDDDMAVLRQFNQSGVTDKTLKSLGNLAPDLRLRGILNGLSIMQLPELALTLPITMGSKYLYNKRTKDSTNKLLNYFKKFTEPKPQPVPFVAPAAPVGSEAILERTE